MNKKGPILIIDDDQDDKDILLEVLTTLNLKNEILYFEDGKLALDYLNVTEDNPFLIFSDVNMPRINGLELREMIQNDDHLRKKCIPYIYFTTATSKTAVMKAYDLSVQGFFIKPNSFKELEIMLQSIIGYWMNCKSPTDYQ